VPARSTSILLAQNAEKKPRKLPCRPPRPPPNRITSRRIPARSSSGRTPFPSGRPSRMRQTKSAGSSSLAYRTALTPVFSSQGSSALDRVHALAVETPVRGLLPANSEPNRPRRDQVSDRNREVLKPRRSQTGPRTLLQEREEVQHEGQSNLEGCETPPRMFSAPHRRIRGPTDLLQKLVNKEYARLTGAPLEEAKAADPEHDGDGGSGEEGGKKKKTPNLSRMLKSRLQKLVDKTDDECAPSPPPFILHIDTNLDPLVDALSLQNSWNSPARSCGLVTTRSSRNPNASRISLYAFPIASGRPDLTPSPRKS
jgi:hypothetical protein